MEWVLLIILSSNRGDIIMQDFNTYNGCNNAKNIIIANREDKFDAKYVIKHIECIEK